jgi:enamine deaminase RidA (YjgF/YER057c/UK114 family)
MLLRSIVTLLLLGATCIRAHAAGPIRPIRPDEVTKTSVAVIVDGAATLAHTAQLWPVDADGAVISPGQVDKQVGALLDRLETTLREMQCSVDRLVKVDVYLARTDVLNPFQRAFARRMTGHARPAVSFVVGSLPYPEALVGLDAIAVTPLAALPPLATCAILPPGPRLYVSGQAEPDVDLAVAARKTLKGLDATLDHLGLDRSRAVRLKAFMQPMTPAAVEIVRREISAHFGGKSVPPLSLVEWRLSPKQPIEIEMIVAGGAPADAAVVYRAPPGLSPSPVFSRVALVSDGPLIYVSCLYGPARATGSSQVESIFATLGVVLGETGSDFRHLVKATYYVSDGPASRALADLRPRYFDPHRPPAASKAFVAGVGLEGRTVTLDMIAVPARK